MDNSVESKTKSLTSDSAPQALYSVEANGDIKLSIFYFEIEDYNGYDNAAVTKALKKFSAFVHILPY